jgi:transposase
MDLDRMLAEDHAARAVWDYVERLDLGRFYEVIRSREGSAGRPANDPKVYLALWIYATLDGVGSAREIERLTREHLAYQWICGGVSVNHHSLSDFRNLAADRLKDLLRQSVTLLMASGLVEIRRVSHDGMKVRASAGAGSFHTRGKLEKIAQQQVERLTAEMEDDSAPATRREKSARERADKQRSRRIERALEEMKEAEKRKRLNNGKKKTEARTSTTDPSARVMKMADGGFRPAYNLHLATDTATRVIVAVEVDNCGTDLHAMVPLAKQIEERFGCGPEQWLADGGCTTLDNIDKMAARGCEVFAPLRERRSGRKSPRYDRPTAQLSSNGESG